MSLAQRPKLGLETLDERIVPALVDLTAVGANTVLGNGAIAHRIDADWNSTYGADAHGRGNLRTVLTINRTGVEQGYNTTARPVQFDQSIVTEETRALRLDRIPVVTVAGMKYYEFVLNANETSGLVNRNVSVDELRFYVSDRGNLKNYNPTTKTLGLNASMVSPVYDMDAGGDNTLLVRAKANVDAVGDMAFLVPLSAFASATPDSFIYIYTKMGGLANASASGGAEEWGVRRQPLENGSLSGNIFLDYREMDENEFLLPGNEQFDPQDTLFLQPVTLTLSGFSLDDGSNLFLNQDGDGDGDYTITVTNGTFSFANLPAGRYILSMNQVQDYDNLQVQPGTGDGIQDGTANGLNLIEEIYLSSGENASGYNFLVGLDDGN